MKYINENLLNKVTKPIRYVGGEYNMVKKNLDEVDIRFAFAFPDTYEVGMSHLGMRILYHVINSVDGVYCERVFAPQQDMQKLLKEEGLDLFSLETKTPLGEFHILGFSLQYELSYTNVLYMLDMANIPLLTVDRYKTHPLVIAGGPCTCNPEPD